MQDHRIGTIVERNRWLIRQADTARASSEDARARSGIAKRAAQQTRKRILGGRKWLGFGHTTSVPRDRPRGFRQRGLPDAAPAAAERTDTRADRLPASRPAATIMRSDARP